MLPQTQPGLLAACADRLDSIVGLIAAGCAPSSQADPFGVRRDAYALLQVEHPCSLTSQFLDITDDEGLVAASCTAPSYPTLLPLFGVWVNFELGYPKALIAAGCAPSSQANPFGLGGAGLPTPCCNWGTSVSPYSPYIGWPGSFFILPYTGKPSWDMGEP